MRPRPVWPHTVWSAARCAGAARRDAVASLLGIARRHIAAPLLGVALFGAAAWLFCPSAEGTPAATAADPSPDAADTESLAAADSLSGNDWLARIDEAEDVPASYGTFRQTITTSGGSQRTLAARSWSISSGDISLLVYTAPPRVAGDKILLRKGGDQIWYYMERRDVTRHFVGSARRQSAMGSDFSYEDLATGDLTEDYTAELLGFEELDGVGCIKLECRPTESGPSYERLLLWAGRDDHLTRRIDYFDEQGRIKTLRLGDFQVIEGRRWGMRLVMTNHREGSQTKIVQEEITFDVDPDPQLFTQSALARDLSRVRP
ncbi:MAG: outer membrane lipoprotein-sorting protein [Candidatus Eisenbacteria bacterium]|nr:outer membrane lipoprotein-sorting protein [Candidatus Eisenbacteria bacterium]